MNKQYWIDYYKKEHETSPSDFAKWVNEKITTAGHRIIDIGAGNLRDTRYFEEQGHFVYSVDNILDRPIEKLISELRKADDIYMRFLLHSIDDNLEDLLISWLFYQNQNTNVFIECRIEGDEPKIYTNHERRLINPEKLIKKFEMMNFRVQHKEIGRNLAVYKTEDPLILRLWLVKK